MKIFEYDICDSDKGIIFAENYEQAVELFKKNYDRVDLENYDASERDTDKYDYGGMINELCDYDGKPKLVFISG